MLGTHLDGARPIATFAVIRRDERGQTLWLAQWNPEWGPYHFVGGHKRPEETFRECLVREIGEELHLREETDTGSLPRRPPIWNSWIFLRAHRPKRPILVS